MRFRLGMERLELRDNPSGFTLDVPDPDPVPPPPGPGSPPPNPNPPVPSDPCNPGGGSGDVN